MSAKFLDEGVRFSLHWTEPVGIERYPMKHSIRYHNSGDTCDLTVPLTPLSCQCLCFRMGGYIFILEKTVMIKPLFH